MIYFVEIQKNIKSLTGSYWLNQLHELTNLVGILERALKKYVSIILERALKVICFLTFLYLFINPFFMIFPLIRGGHFGYFLGSVRVRFGLVSSVIVFFQLK